MEPRRRSHQDRLKAREVAGQSFSYREFGVNGMENRSVCLKGSNLGHLLYSEHVIRTRMQQEIQLGSHSRSQLEIKNGLSVGMDGTSG